MALRRLGAILALAVFGLGRSGKAAAHRPVRPPARPLAGSPRIAVIGAGISGLTAVHELAKRGLAATLYEATERPGGRILAVPVPEAGLRFDAGAELVNSEDAELRELLDELGIALDRRNPGAARQVFVHQGRPMEHSEFLDRLFESSLPALKTLERDLALVEEAYRQGAGRETLRRFDRISIQEYLSSLGATPELESLANALITPEFGAPYQGLTSLALLESVAVDTARRRIQVYPGKDEAFLVRGGPGAIVEALADRYRDSLKLSHRLTSVTSSNGRTFRLSFQTPQGTKTVEADYVYTSLPLPRLAQVSVRIPGFTEALRRDMAAVRYGANAKLALYFTRRLWRELGYSGDGFSGEGLSFWDSSEGQPGPAGSLTVYMEGSGLTEAEGGDLARRMLAKLESVFPGLSRLYLGHRLRVWPQSYPGADLPGERTGRSIPGKPLGNFFWAGDFFSARGSQSYMNGAVEAAQRAARSLAALAALEP